MTVQPPPPHETDPAEVLTPGTFLLGMVLSVVMGAANVYLGLRAGMTVAASIPAAVIAIGLSRVFQSRASIQQANLVQTAASAGESLAAGIIFTMPALILIGEWENFDFTTTTLIALTGGWLGVLFMIPMRRVFVTDNQELKFPEGVACAEVLEAGVGEGEASRDGVGVILRGILLGAGFKISEAFLHVLRPGVEWATRIGGRIAYFGIEAVPALVAVGYIVELGIAAQVFLGGILGWSIAIPLIGGDPTPGQSVVELANAIWYAKVRYIGVGAMVVGGVASIWQVRSGLVDAVQELTSALGSGSSEDSGETPATERNIGGRTIVVFLVLSTLLTTWLYYQMLQHHAGITLLTTAVMLVMAFFFTAVASYIVGLVGSSNSPVSGMTITAVLGTAGLLHVFGYGGSEGIVATLGVAGVVCCVTCTSGDVCNDLKTGELVGASPRLQQIMQLAGVAVAALVMAPVMTVLHTGTGGIGSRDLPAPQAGLFASLTQGFFGDGKLPWDMVAWGVGIGLLLWATESWLARRKSSIAVHVMPVAVGIYLPFGLAIPILLGGLVHHYLSTRVSKESRSVGVLAASGVIAGESLLGVGLGILAFLKITSVLQVPVLGPLLGQLFPTTPAFWSGWVPELVTVGALVLVALWIARQVLVADRGQSTAVSDSTEG